MLIKIKWILFVTIFFVIGISEQADPLPSWNNTNTKRNIINYVENAVNKKSPYYIKEEDRIATFDNDGTLVPEKPLIQILFSFEKIKEMSKSDKSLLEKQPFKAIVTGDNEYLKTVSEDEVISLTLKTLTNISERQLRGEVKDFVFKTTYPHLNKTIDKIVYKPQIELIKYLQKNKFKVYIRSGGTVDFMRGMSEELYGIDSENVIGSFNKYKYNETTGEMILEPELNSYNDGREKAANIALFIGKVPVISVGNVGAGGDIYMLRYSQNGNKNYKTLQILVNHDDDKREFKYGEKNNISLNWADKYKWNVVSMKNDWKEIF